jgi:hypothetical protein
VDNPLSQVVINVRGTSGSGKSTLVKKIMDRCVDRVAVHIPGRKQPMGYTMHYQTPNGMRALFVPGHYESACGGCDTISKDDTGQGNSYDRIFGLIKEYYGKGYSVLFEGLLISGDFARCKNLKDEGYPLEVVSFNLTVEDCIKSVLERRAAKGNDKPFNEKNTREKHRLLEKCCKKMNECGIPVYIGSRDGCLGQVEDLLGVEPSMTATRSEETAAAA